MAAKKKKLQRPKQSFVDFKIENLMVEYNELEKARSTLNKFMIRNTKQMDKLMIQFQKWHKIKRTSQS